MSCNINHATYLSGKLTISIDNAIALEDEFASHLAECNLLDDDAVKLGPGANNLTIVQPWWSGNCSGDGYETVLPAILAHTKGHAVLLFVWENGEQTALQVDDGVVTSKKVKVTTK